MTLMIGTPIDRKPITHELKTWQSYFHGLVNGTKTFELRKDDRDFRIGDHLHLRETCYGNNEYTGREEFRTISYILRREKDLGLAEGYAILALAPFKDAELLQLIRDSVAKFNAMSIDEQDAMLQAQRESWVRGEVALRKMGLG